MFFIQLADICIGIENKYPFVEHQCKDFLCADAEPLFTIRATDEEIAEEQSISHGPADTCESVCIYRHICEQLAPHGIFLMHSSVVEVDGYAYAFTAKSGVGKSTHTALWIKNVPHARVLNGDKPLYRLERDGSLTVFGTPWNGKENWGENISAPLAAVCFIERGSTNVICKTEETEIISRLLHQLYLRGNREAVGLQLKLMDALVRAVPYYTLSCTVSDEAALLAWKTMQKT